MPTSLKPRNNLPTAQPGLAKSSGGKTRLLAATGISYVLLACVGFVALDVIKRNLPSDPLASPEKSTIWWATKQFQAAAAKRKPDVVLLGSSLMIAAQNDCDATFFNVNFDAVKHYRSLYLESKLSKAKGRDVKTASFVIGGQMASDGYAIIKALLSKHSAPETIVWGVAPRDFLDATLTHSDETETVKLMSRIADEENLLQKKLPFWSRIEKSLKKVSAIYGKNEELRAVHQQAVEQTLSAVTPVSYTPGMQAPAWLLHQASLSLPEDNKAGQWIVRPCQYKGAEPTDNRAEYEARYRPFKPLLFQEQLRCYEEALKEAHRQGTNILVINMPLTPDNLRLLPPGVYDLYLNNIRKSAALCNARFLDLDNSKDFSGRDFSDPVHLNGFGAIKFMNIVANSLGGS